MMEDRGFWLKASRKRVSECLPSLAATVGNTRAPRESLTNSCSIGCIGVGAVSGQLSGVD